MSNYAVILAGGRGIRFWPLSRHDEPKQFLKLFGNHSLLQHTALRISKIIEPSKIFIVTNKDYVDTIRYQLKELGFPTDNIIVEISPKNTAAAIAYVSHKIASFDSKAVLAVFPADHYIKKEKAFLQSTKKALSLAEKGELLIFGIKPQRPETGYGYVQVEKKKNITGALKVLNFIEKPVEAAAKKLIKHNNIFWNGGIFVSKASVLLVQTQKFLPKLYSVLQEKNKTRFIDSWNKLESISIDYGIMEKSKDIVYLIPLDCGWTDLGNWSTIDLVLSKDKKGNALTGDVLTINTENTTVWSSQHLVVAAGLKDMIIADTPDALLVMPKSESQHVSEIVNILKTKKRYECMVSRIVSRPWGKYEVLNDAGNFKTKMVEVLPNKRLSLQLHQKRAEHWVVVEGEAVVTIEDKNYTVKHNESIYVPCGKKHRIANKCEQKLIFIEVQTGSYLGEDDIQRFDDDYERTVG